MEAPNGFITLCEAVDAAGIALFGASWQYAIPLNTEADTDRGAHERVITVIAKGCEAGEIAVGYRKWNGAADDLDPDVWRLPHWRNYFATGTIDLELPLLDDRNRPVTDGRTARCTREIFVRGDSLADFIKSLAPARGNDDESLRDASTQEIRVEISNVASDPANDRPNVKQLAKLVIPRLRELGLRASENRIIEIAGEDQFKSLRRQPGKTKASEQPK